MNWCADLSQICDWEDETNDYIDKLSAAVVSQRARVLATGKKTHSRQKSGAKGRVTPSMVKCGREARGLPCRAPIWALGMHIVLQPPISHLANQGKSSLCCFSIKPQAQIVPWSQGMVGLIRWKAEMFVKQSFSLRV